MKKYVMSLDVGSTSIRAILFNKKCEEVFVYGEPLKTIITPEGYIEHNPLDILQISRNVMEKVLRENNVSPTDVDSIGITNQRESTILFSKENGEHLYNCISWQCKRSSEYCEKLIELGYEEEIKKKTGLFIDSYFSGSKAKWILDNVSLAEDLNRDNVLFGTIDTYLIYNLGIAKKHLTDKTNVSRTMLFDIYNVDYDDDLLSLFSLKREMLPKVLDSGEFFDYFEVLDVLIPVYGVCGDQQSALFGHLGIEEGSSKCTFGTGAFFLYSCGPNICHSKELITSLGASTKGETNYVLEGSIFACGSLINYLRDDLNFFDSYSKLEEDLDSIRDQYKIFFPSGLSGYGTPHYNMDKRGAIFNIAFDTKKIHIVKAALESIAFGIYDVLEILKRENLSIEYLSVDGGLTNNKYFLGFLKDILDINIFEKETKEVTAQGVALLSGLSSGFYESVDSIKENMKSKEVKNGRMPKKTREELLLKWKEYLDGMLSMEV